MENQFKPLTWLQKKAKREKMYFNTKIENEVRSTFNTELYLKYLAVILNN